MSENQDDAVSLGPIRVLLLTSGEHRVAQGADIDLCSQGKDDEEALVRFERVLLATLVSAIPSSPPEFRERWDLAARREELRLAMKRKDELKENPSRHARRYMKEPTNAQCLTVACSACGVSAGQRCVSIETRVPLRPHPASPDHEVHARRGQDWLDAQETVENPHGIDVEQALAEIKANDAWDRHRAITGLLTLAADALQTAAAILLEDEGLVVQRVYEARCAISMALKGSSL